MPPPFLRRTLVNPLLEVCYWTILLSIVAGQIATISLPQQSSPSFSSSPVFRYMLYFFSAPVRNTILQLINISDIFCRMTGDMDRAFGAANTKYSIIHIEGFSWSSIHFKSKFFLFLLSCSVKIQICSEETWLFLMGSQYHTRLAYSLAEQHRAKAKVLSVCHCVLQVALIWGHNVLLFSTTVKVWLYLKLEFSETYF